MKKAPANTKGGSDTPAKKQGKNKKVTDTTGDASVDSENTDAKKEGEKEEKGEDMSSLLNALAEIQGQAAPPQDASTSAPSAGENLKGMMSAITPEVKDKRGVIPAFSSSEIPMVKAVTLRTKSGITFELPMLENLTGEKVVSFLQQLLHIANSVAAQSASGITLSATGESDKELNAEDVLKIKGDPLEALGVILERNLSMLLTRSALLQMQVLCKKSNSLNITTSEIVKAIKEKAERQMTKECDPNKYVKQVKTLTAAQPSLAKFGKAEDYVLDWFETVETIHRDNSQTLNTKAVAPYQHSKAMVGMLKPKSLLIYFLHRLSNETGYTESWWNDVRDIMSRVWGYSQELDEQRKLDPNYLNPYTLNSHLPMWNLGINSKFYYFTIFWPKDGEDNKESKGSKEPNSEGSKRRKPSGSGWGGKPASGDLPYFPVVKALDKGKDQDKKVSFDNDKDATPAAAAPVVGKVEEQTKVKDKTCIVCSELGHKGDECTKACACGIVPATSKAVTGKKHNPWDCKEMKVKRGVNKRKRDDA
jgi:hypothetical protein